MVNMARFHFSSLLAVCFVLLCTIYWLQRPVASYYDDSIRTNLAPKDDEIMLQADGGGSKTRFVKSHSAGQYDKSGQEPFDENAEQMIELERERLINAYAGLKGWPRQRSLQTSTTITSTFTSTSIEIATGLTPVPTSTPTPNSIPRRIWQVGSKEDKKEHEAEIQTWQELNRGNHAHVYSLLDWDAADQFVKRSFSRKRLHLWKIWTEVTDEITRASQSIVNTHDGSHDSTMLQIRAILIRYLLMFVRGGVFSDMSTTAMKKVDKWVPTHMADHAISAIVGIEFDGAIDPVHARPISFATWIFATAPGHPIFEKAISRVVSNLEFLAQQQRVASISKLKTEKSVLDKAIGPGMFSDVVLEVIQEQLVNDNVSWSSFSDQKEPTLYGDVLVLPIHAFAGDSKHGPIGDIAYGEQLVRQFVKVHTQFLASGDADQEAFIQARNPD